MNSVDSTDCNQQQPEEDPLLKFIDYARSALSPEIDGHSDPIGNGAESSGPSWNWITSRILRTCSAYSSGVTAAILLSDLTQVWVFSRIRFWVSVSLCVWLLRKCLGIRNEQNCVDFVRHGMSKIGTGLRRKCPNV